MARLRWIFALCFPLTYCQSVIRHDASLDEIVDVNVVMELLAEHTRDFAHEGPVHIAATNELYFVSNRYINNATGAQHSEIQKINLTNNQLSRVPTQPEIIMGNGAYLYSDREIVWCSQGYNDTPSTLILLDTVTLNVTRLNLQPELAFSSLNDVFVSDLYGGLFFTDPYYGFAQGFRPQPSLPPRVYYANRKTLHVSSLADWAPESRPNGVVHSLDGSVLYVSDTGNWIGNGTVNEHVSRSVYAYDMKKDENGLPVLSNRRHFVREVDNGLPDVMKTDEKNNLYVAVADGVNVYSPSGVFMGKLKIPAGGPVASFAWADKKLIVLAQTRIFAIQLKVSHGTNPITPVQAAETASGSEENSRTGVMAILLAAVTAVLSS